jgi:hypothetical protein
MMMSENSSIRNSFEFDLFMWRRPVQMSTGKDTSESARTFSLGSIRSGEDWPVPAAGGFAGAGAAGGVAAATGGVAPAARGGGGGSAADAPDTIDRMSRQVSAGKFLGIGHSA